MYFLYNILLVIFLILTSPFWVFKVLTKEKHRKGFLQKAGILLPEIRKKTAGEVRVHVHAVSVGEVIAATPFVKALKKRHPEITLFVSTVTPTGNEVARKRFSEADYILYSPYDLPWVVKKFINRVRPDLYITVETELWPNFLRQVKRAGARTLIINGRISPHTLKGYARIRPFMKRVLAHIDLFCMQSEEDAKRLITIGAPEGTVKVTGNMKYDQSFMNLTEEDLTKKRALLGVGKDDRVIIAGSTHRGEDELIVKSYKACLKERNYPILQDTMKHKNGRDKNVPPIDGKQGFPTIDDRRGFLTPSDGPPGEKTRLIIVPRHPERASEIEEIVRTQGLIPLKRTALDSRSTENIPGNPVLIVDTIGELAALYSMATVVIIGGSFIPHGGQNPLEALYYRKPVVFGPHMFNFREIMEEILKNGAGVSIEKPEDLAGRLKELLEDTKRQREMGEKGYQIIVKNRGAAERNLDIAGKLLLNIEK